MRFVFICVFLSNLSCGKIKLPSNESGQDNYALDVAAESKVERNETVLSNFLQGEIDHNSALSFIEENCENSGTFSAMINRKDFYFITKPLIRKASSFPKSFTCAVCRFK